MSSHPSRRDLGASASKPSKGNGKGSQSGKLIFAAVLLLVAGGVFAWSQGWILAEKPAPHVESEELKQQFEEQKQTAKKMQESPQAPIVGGE
jgi:hypothetical protein